MEKAEINSIQDSGIKGESNNLKKKNSIFFKV